MTKDMKGKVLVTGANGFLATNAIAALVEAGYEVRGLLRRKGTYIGRNFLELELVEGSFTNPETVRKALMGCDYVVHIAALTDQSASADEYRKINVDATVRLAQEAVEAGVSRFVYVSSANAFAYGSKEKPGDETRPTRPPFTESQYALSKAAAQKEILKFKDRMDVVVVNPTFMIGPMDIKPSSGRIITMAYGRKVMAAPPGGKNFVHVGDAARGIVAALEKGRSGEAYLLCGENLNYHDFYRTLSKVSGKKMHLIDVPGKLLLAVGHICDLLYKIGIKTDATLTNMKLLCIDNYYTNAKARKDLGIDFRSTEDAVRDAVRWFRENNMLK
ncbi:MAG: NAD-dependent epimerase/dehydratase family protein [Candidatus Cryptobacteroides sp.]